MKQDMYLDIGVVHVNADQMQVFVKINNVRIMINVDVIYRIGWQRQM